MVREWALIKLLDKLRELIIISSLKHKIILSHCLKFKKNTENINPRVSKTSNRKTILLSKYAVCGSKKSRFIKSLKNLQEASGLLVSLGIKIPLNKIRLLRNILF